MSETAPLQELSFEELMQNLTSLAESLASDTDGLEKALKKYEQGMLVAEECLRRLDQAEQRVMQIKDGMTGESP